MREKLISDFINNSFFFPAEKKSNCPEFLEKKIIHIKLWINHSTFAGDIISYLQYLGSSNDPMIRLADSYYGKILNFGFSGLADSIAANFPLDAIKKITPDYFKLNEDYTSFDICFSMSLFNVQRSIIFSRLYPNIVILKAIVGSTEYDNGWIKENTDFKYQLFTTVRNIRAVQNPNHEFNMELMPNLQNKILLFIKGNERSYRHVGEYYSKSINEDKNGTKWFHLVKK